MYVLGVRNPMIPTANWYPNPIASVCRLVLPKRKRQPQYRYWATVLELELLVLEYVRSVRQGSLTMYVDALTELVPCAPPQNLTYSLHEAGGGNDWWNRFHPACGTSIDSWHTSRQM